MAGASQAQWAAGLLTGGQAVGTAVAERTQASAIDASADFDTKLANLQAADAIRRGESSAKIAESTTKGVVGRARASMAAGGVAVDSGSAVDVQVQDSTIGALNAQMIRNNAAREAWGIGAESTLQSLGSKQAAAALRARSLDTLITGGARTYGLFAKNKSASDDTGPLPKFPRIGSRAWDDSMPAGTGEP